jgi:hypothetical protein
MLVPIYTYKASKPWYSYIQYVPPQKVSMQAEETK